MFKQTKNPDLHFGKENSCSNKQKTKKHLEALAQGARIAGDPLFIRRNNYIASGGELGITLNSILQTFNLKKEKYEG